MQNTQIWHNPRCSKSREAVAISEDLGSNSEIIKYMDARPSVAELKSVLKKLGFSTAREWMRTSEAIYKELGLKDETDEEKLLEAMSQNTKLIQRPVLIKGDKAIIGRPVETIAVFLNA